MPATGVQIGSVYLPAYDDQPADAYGTIWGLTALDGWYDGWEGSGTVDKRSQADGDWITPQWASGRVVHVSGTIEDTSWDNVTRAFDRLLAQLPFRQLGSMIVTAGEGTYPAQTALIRQHEKPLLTDRFNNRADFSLSVFAPDPRKYETVLRSLNLVLPILSGGIAPPLTPPFTVTGSTSVSQGDVYNDGNVTTYPTLTITGPCPPATITNLTTSESLRVVDAVPAGQTLVIDVRNGTATINGQSRRVLGTWWGLQPGLNTISFTADTYDAGATLGLTFRSAWK